MSCGCGGSSGGGGGCGCSPPIAPSFVQHRFCGIQGITQRLAPKVDRIRARTVEAAGLTPYDVFLVWTHWTGRERGEGEEQELRRHRIAPSPVVEDLSNVSLALMSAGVLPVGSLRLSSISTRYTADELHGRLVPPDTMYDGCGEPMRSPFPSAPLDALEPVRRDELGRPLPPRKDRIPEPFGFFYEVVLRTAPTPQQRMKFRPMSEPFYDAGKFGWSLTLERVSEDRDRQGRSNYGTDRG
jgi:hypothetical protein